MKLIVTFCLTMITMAVGLKILGFDFPAWQVACGASIPTVAVWFIWSD